MIRHVISVLLPALLLLVSSRDGRAQIVIDSAHGLVGEEVRVPIRYTGPGLDTLATVTLNGSFHLSNPTVFFPEVFRPTQTRNIMASRLDRLTDSTYAFSFSLGPRQPGVHAGDTLCYLAGEALAGYDSVCVLRFSGLSVNDGPSPEAVGVITTTSVGTPFPYIRYATLEPGYPNPAQRGSVVSWGFRVDKRSPVEFILYTIHGQEMYRHDLGEIGPGVYLEHFEITFDVPTGVYLVRLATNSGEANQFMHVIR